MTGSFDNSAVLRAKVYIRPESMGMFADWQAKLNAAITPFSGFISLEILLLYEDTHCVGNIVQRFSNSNHLADWLSSAVHQDLMEILKDKLVDETLGGIQEIESTASQVKGNVTEVFVTQVSPEKENAYQKWIAEMHRVEAKFPGFRGVYVQSPMQSQANHWITFLHFDTPGNLDRWLNSPERKKVLKRSESLIASLESHRVISPFAGWFSSEQGGGVFPVWKQTMLVLLVLFPIVMLELEFLSPLTAGLNGSLSMFIGNVISVSLIAWPCMPIVLKFLNWWLMPRGPQESMITFFGTLLVIFLYALEIFVFWR